VFEDASYFVVTINGDDKKSFTADTVDELITVFRETGLEERIISQIAVYQDEEVSIEDSLLIVDQYI